MGRGKGRRWSAALLAVVALGIASLSGSAGAAESRTASVYTGFGFDACTAPSTAALNAWQASPYRALGIYIGGVNRACGDGNLSASWVSSTTQSGWSLLPLYVGLQAPCVSQSGLTKLTLASAAPQGLAAASDAVSRASGFGLAPGTPIYFDMEGYATNNASCSQAVEAFLANWVNGLHAAGYLAGVYGSAASTIRDLATNTSAPADDAWIANWNGQSSVFGDPYVSDSLWPNHQRVHQYKGGHKETYGGVTIDIDSDYVDAAVVGGAAAPPPPVVPVPAPAPTAPAGSVGSGDGQASATWPTAAFAQPVVVTLTPHPAAQPAGAAYSVQLGVADATTAAPIASFAQPVTVHIVAQPTAGLAAVYSTDGTTWQPVPTQAGQAVSYAREPDGSFDIATKVSGFFALTVDATPPSAPADVRGRFSHGSLILTWHAATDNSGAVAGYRVTLTNQPLATVVAPIRNAAIRAFHPGAPSVYRVIAVDAAGNASHPSQPIVVVPSNRPKDLPRSIPAWAWQLFTWEHSRVAARPTAAPRVAPAWFWHWAKWRTAPFRVRA